MEIDFEKNSVEEIRNGFALVGEDGCYRCLVCGEAFQVGEVYRMDGRFFEAPKAVQRHVKEAHGGRLSALLHLDSKYVPFTENQKELLTLLHAGLTDNEIAKRMGVTASTVRHQRFVFREKAKQAKMLLAIYGLAAEQGGDAMLPVHPSARMVDDRYLITEQEREKYLHNAFESLSPLRLKVFPAKEKKKLAVLLRIAEEFEPRRRYAEGEVNAVLEGIYPDFATLRRYLIEYGLMERTTDCKEYWLK